MHKSPSVILLLTIFTVIFPVCGRGSLEDLHNGDIIFHESLSSQGEVITIVTGSPYTHMGIIFIRNGKKYVLEAVQPVKLTPLKAWIKRGRKGHFVVKRLKNAEKLLTPVVLKKIKKTGAAFTGRNYDGLFQWNDKRIYCSELVWKIYKRALGIEIGSLQKFRDFDLSHPKVRALVRKRYGRSPDPREPVISPAQMFSSPLIETVVEGKNNSRFF